MGGGKEPKTARQAAGGDVVRRCNEIWPMKWPVISSVGHVISALLLRCMAIAELT